MSVANLWDVSNPNLTTQQGQSWATNATERTLQTTGRSAQQGLWIRKISLVVYGSNANSGGNTSQGQFGDFSQAKGQQQGNLGGLDLSQLRINFELTKTVKDTPNELYAKIYNMSRNTGPATENKVKQYARVQLAAGYQNDQYGMIFDGTVALYIQGKENPVDSYLEIHAGDWDEQYNYFVTGLNFPAGTTPQQKVEQALGKANVPIANIDMGPGQQPSLREHSHTGHLTSLIRDQTRATQSDFFVDDGKAYVIPWNGYRPGDVVVLSPQTGLVGIPKVTPAGIEAICLLNPKLRIGGLVKIDSTLLSGVPYSPDTMAKGFSAESGFLNNRFSGTGPWTYSSAAISPTGQYKILMIKHYGDTRGNPWYTAIICSTGPGGQTKNPGTAYLRSRIGQAEGGGGSGGSSGNSSNTGNTSSNSGSGASDTKPAPPIPPPKPTPPPAGSGEQFGPPAPPTPPPETAPAPPIPTPGITAAPPSHGRGTPPPGTRRR